MAKLSDEQIEQRRKASVAAAAKPHEAGCTCPGCYYRARKIAREGRQQDFPSRVDWAASQEAKRAARTKVVEDARVQAEQAARVVVDVDADQAKGVVDDEDMPRVVTQPDGSRVFVASDKASSDAVDSTIKKPEQPEAPPDIITFTTSPDWLGLDLSAPQRSLLKASNGIPLSEEEMGYFRACTGRTTDPRINFPTVVVIAGARAGKDSRLVAPTALYEAVFGGHSISKGETPTIALYAQGKDAATVTFNYISDYATKSPRLSEMVEGEPLRTRLTLDNGFVVRTFPATRIAARAFSLPVAVLNESAFYRFEGSANADVEILTSVRRGMLNFPRRKLLIVSTPYSKAGILYDHFRRFYGRDDSQDVLVWRAPTSFMNPSITEERLEEERRVMDPAHFAREYLAEFLDDAAAWLPSELIESAVDLGIAERPPLIGVKYTMGIDASGAGSCAFAVSIGHPEEQGAGNIVVIQDVLRSFTKPPSGKLNLRAVVREILGLAASYNHIEHAFSDRYAGQWPLQAFEDEAAALGMRFTLRDPTVMRGQDTIRLNKSEAFRETAPLFRTSRIRLVDNPSQVRELRNLRNLEARPTEAGPVKIGRPMVRGEMDDQATAMATMAAMISIKKKPGGFVPGVGVWNRNHTDPHRGQRVREDGFVEGSGGTFIAKNGEIYYDPRFS